MPTFKVYKGTPNGIQESETTRPDLTGDQVLVKVTASGICGTDLHYKSANTALGHEGVGVVRGVGPSVQCLRPGDRVGWGYQADSCGLCTSCLAGSEEYCAERKIYGEANLDQGISPRPRYIGSILVPHPGQFQRRRGGAHDVRRRDGVECAAAVDNRQQT